MKEWIIDLKREWESVNTTREQEIRKRRCIYRVPKYIRDLNSDVYAPYVVSLGPYHHGCQHLKEMEKLKRRMLSFFLSKIGKTLENAVAAIEKDVQELMDAYDGLDERWVSDRDSFVQLMVLDACFILEFLYMLNGMDSEGLSTFGVDLSPESLAVTRDLLLLENQVPHRALEILADLGGEKVATKDIKRLYIIAILHSDNVTEKNITYHFLDAMRMSMIDDGKDAFLFEHDYSKGHNPPTAKELVEAGVKIEASDTRNVKFERGVLKLPKVPMSAYLDSALLNAMAYEKMKDYDPELFSLKEFMDCLIKSGDDVAILRRKGIIHGMTGSDQEVLALLSRMKGSWPPPRKHRTEGVDVAKLLVDFRGKRLNRWVARFRRSYLADPWVFISLLAAFFLLLLTLLGTIYTVLSYYHSNK